MSARAAVTRTACSPELAKSGSRLRGARRSEQPKACRAMGQKDEAGDPRRSAPSRRKNLLGVKIIPAGEREARAHQARSRNFRSGSASSMPRARPLQPCGGARLGPRGAGFDLRRATPGAPGATSRRSLPAAAKSRAGGGSSSAGVYRSSCEPPGSATRWVASPRLRRRLNLLTPTQLGECRRSEVGCRLPVFWAWQVATSGATNRS